MNIILFITQISSVITAFLGLLALSSIYSALNNLLPGKFRNLILNSFFFILIISLGVVSMSLYHVEETYPLGDLQETVENLWYVGMFLGLLFSLYESSKIISFYSPIVAVIKRFKSQKNKKRGKKR